MAAVFNPPPTWPLEPGFTPTADWMPDPFWPSAPTGWQFWVDEVPSPNTQNPYHPTYSAPLRVSSEAPAGPSLSTPSRRRATVIVGAVALVMAVVATVTGIVAWKHHDGSPPLWPENMLAGTFPTAPTAAWTVSTSTLLSDKVGQVATPVFGAAFYGSPGAIVVGDHVVIHVVRKNHSSQDENAELVSLSLVDGHKEWSIPAQVNDGCARNLLGDRLVCQRTGKNGQQGQLQFIDVGTGDVDSTVASRASILASDGTSLYTAFYNQDVTGLTVSKGTAENPASAWTKTVPNEVCQAYGDGDGQDLHVAHGVLWGYLGGAEIALRADNGSPLFDHEVVNVRTREPDTIIATRCRPGTDFDGWPTEVATLSGHQLFTSPVPLPREDLSVFTGGPPPLITARGDALDPTTGNTLWRLPGRTSSGAGWVIGNIGAVSDGNGMAAYNMASGDRLWHSGEILHSNAVTDGERAVISTGYGGIAAISLADGSRTWEVGIAVGEGVVIYATSRGVLAVGTSGVSLLRPTGPAASVPAFGTTPTDKSGGAPLATKCGRPAHFEPQAIRAQSGALVITMKIVAHCPGGDVLSSPQTRLSVTSDGENVASGTFDLAAQPIAIPAGSGVDGSPSISHDFVFPAGTFWRIPVSLNAIPEGGASQTGPTDLGVNTLVVDCQQDGPSGSTKAPNGSAGSRSSTATGPATPSSGNNETASFDALRALANADRPFVSANLTDRWVPQLSSKRPGLVADGIVWDNAATLREHLDLRLRYPEVRLLYSGDWSTFSAPDFWVTIAGVTFLDSDSALGWCRDHGFDREHCYAKLVSTSHPVDGTTAFNP
ncbi:putative Pyrrolo-quinoline quinone [uncultured Mycobacterium sp.]|uniref:Putative Pyrrolo-quinoline quinone n=1 Tax=uncultured Mycobacterium sp. TaxID=171292 RepID=A0A1Y5PDS5_9MYCO|nr:putative Pyrrolo-quinoline quinone [uncultured Mycobacterium sp.]